MADDERIEHAVRETVILRPPRQKLSTFGTTNIHYYFISEPAYAELEKDVTETVVREGRIVAERPRIVTPYYLSQLEGFGPEARRYFDSLMKMHGPSTPGLFYAYKNEPKELIIISDSLSSVVIKLNDEIEKRGDPLVSIIKGQDELWDVSLLKFIYEMTRHSLETNVRQLGSRGLLDVDARGVPVEARLRIEKLFVEVARGECATGELKLELERWGLFEEYEDRFLAFFRRKGKK